MIEKITNSWKLAKECWRVLMLDKEMLMFPTLSAVTTLVISALIFYPLWASGYFERPEIVQVDISQIFSLATVAKYFLTTIIASYFLYVIVTFFNTGLITCAFIRLRGGDPILTDGFQIAGKRLPQILTWSIIATSVGLLLRMIKGRDSFLGKVLSGLLGLGWRVGTFVVIPVIVAEGKSAMDALKRSGQIIKKNWGEALTLEIGFSLLATPALIPAISFGALSSAVSDVSPTLALALLILAGFYTFLVFLIFSTLDAIAKAALYMHATSGSKLENFDKEILETVFMKGFTKKPATA